MAVTFSSTTQWETAVIQAWGMEPDCSPSLTGMCDACGIGAPIVEMNTTDGSTNIRTIMTGPEGNESPYNYDESSFEIASYTKHFAALAMVWLQDSIPGLADTTIGQWLPCDWPSASYDAAAAITLEELRLHTSGLPPQAPNHEDAGFDGNPFAGYKHEMICSSLLALTGLPSRGRFVYSNYAYGALGYSLTFAAAEVDQQKTRHDLPQNPTYENIINVSVLLPFHMNHTSVQLDENGWKTAARGCDRGLKRGTYAMRRGEYGILQGNGALSIARLLFPIWPVFCSSPCW